VLVKKFNDQLQEGQKDEDQRYQFLSDTLQYEAQIARTIRRAAGRSRSTSSTRSTSTRRTSSTIGAQLGRRRTIGARSSGSIPSSRSCLTEKAQATDLANRQNQSPMDAYLNSLPQSLSDVHAQLEDIEVTGLKNLNSDLGDATAKALGLSGALAQTVSSMVKLGLEVAESKISGAWGKNGTVGQSAQLSAAGGELSAAGATLNSAGSVLHSSALIWQGVAEQIQLAATQLEAAGTMSGGGGFNGGMLGSLFSGGGSSSLSSLFGAAGGFGNLFGSTGAFTASSLAGASFDASSLFDFAALGFAGGGYLSGPGTPTSDSIPLMGSNGEYMIQATRSRTVRRACNTPPAWTRRWPAAGPRGSI
jgi:hypothetical protein